MSIFVLKPFDRNLKRYSISEEKLFNAAQEIMAGQYEADLGGGVYKKRIALSAGKSGGARSVIAFKYGGNLFFVNGWSKSDIKKHGSNEISADELAAYRTVAKQLLAMSRAEVDRALDAGIMRELTCDD
jgi:hypothetical protein